MQNRTIIRTTLDIFLNNAIIQTIASLVNFCNEQQYFYKKKLKFLKKMPLSKITDVDNNRYLFSNGKFKIENEKLL